MKHQLQKRPPHNDSAIIEIVIASAALGLAFLALLGVPDTVLSVIERFIGLVITFMIHKKMSGK